MVFCHERRLSFPPSEGAMARGFQPWAYILCPSHMVFCHELKTSSRFSIKKKTAAGQSLDHLLRSSFHPVLWGTRDKIRKAFAKKGQYLQLGKEQESRQFHTSN